LRILIQNKDFNI